jgi:outer membrane protein TolC
MKKLILLCWLPCCLHSQTFTLVEAVRYAQEHNERVLQYQQRLEQRKYDYRATFGNFAPNVKLQGSVNHLNDALIIDLNPIRTAMIELQSKNQVELANLYTVVQGKPALSAAERQYVQQQARQGLDQALPAFEETLKKQDYYSAAFIVTQPLFLGGKLLAAHRYASAEQGYANSELIKVRNEVMQEVVERYLNVLLLKQVVQTRRDVLAGLQQHQQQAARLQEEGLIAPYHLLRAEVAVAEAERNLHDDLNRMDLAELALRQSCALSEEQRIILSDSLHYIPMPDSTLLIQQSVAGQPLLSMLKNKRRSAAQSLAVARAAYLPEIAAFGKYELYPEYLSALEPRWVIGVQASITLFDGFKRFQQVQSARHLQKEVAEYENYAWRQVTIWQNKALSEAWNSRTRYQKMAVNCRLAAESVRMTEKRFSAGLGASLEVVDSRLLQEKISLERLQSLYDYYRSLTDYYVASGKPEDLLQLWQSR